MLVNVKLLGDGLGPAERVVSLQTKGGETEEVILSLHDLEGHRIDVGGPVAFANGHYLVELPREVLPEDGVSGYQSLKPTATFILKQPQNNKS